MNRQGKYKEAMELHTKGLKIKLVTIGPDHPDVVHPKPKPETQDPKPPTRNPKPKIRNPTFKIRYLKLRVMAQRSSEAQDTSPNPKL